MCEVEEEKLRSHKAFTDACIYTTYSQKCCRSWSLGNYIALLSNKSKCQDITDDDVQSVHSLLTQCAPYYKNITLVPDCGKDDSQNTDACKKIPKQCKQHNAVFYILHYIADTGFLAQKESTKLTHAVAFLPLAAGVGTETLYKTIEHEHLGDAATEIVAMNFQIKQDLFDLYLRRDTLWFSLSLLSIFIIMWIYTSSLFLTIMTVVSLFLSLEISYFLYTMVFEIKFFPFMNLMTVVILVGIGVDDVFIYCKVWATAKLDKNAGTLEKLVSDTLKHATLSMSVTSFTTAAAFYASYVSYITALSCFAVFSGTVIIINFLIMVTWIPATIVIHEKWCSECCTCYSPDFYAKQKGCLYHLSTIPNRAYFYISDLSRVFFDQILPCVVIKLRYLWIPLFGLLGAGGIIVVFYYPRLKLPWSNEFQVFAHDHPFEVYDFRMKELFWFEKSARANMGTFPITIVWGVKPTDNGNQLDPFSKGAIELDARFNIADPKSQTWLLDFCRDLRETSYYRREIDPQISNCFIEHFQKFMRRRCMDIDGNDLSPCCVNSEFPYTEETFNKCLKVYLPIVEQSQGIYYINRNAGPRFSKDTGELQGMIVEFNSKESFTFNYVKIGLFYQELENFVREQLRRAPVGMKGGWFISHLEFYDLQHSIAQGTPIAIGVSIAISSVVAFLTTLNVLITLYAMLSISAAIFVTIASLVLLGWELNILESVTLSVAVGLSIDFTLHYGMAYRLAPDLDREMRLVSATGRMGSPVFMAAFTTFLAGALMMPSTVLAYRQLGTFLMIVMTTSWIYATFFFQALLRAAGPEGGFGQFHWPASNCCSGREHVDKTKYAMSESTLSSSSTNHVNSSETHELEPLTDRTESHPFRSRLSKFPQRTLTESFDSMDTDTSSRRDLRLSPNHRSANAANHLYSRNSSQSDSESVTRLLDNTASDNSTATQVKKVDSNRNTTASEVWLKQQSVV